MMMLLLPSLFSTSSGPDPTSCTPHHDPLVLSLGLFLCLGLVISYLPQLYRIIARRSSLGFSPWFLLLGATSSASTFLNVVALQWGSVRCCKVLTAGQCAEGLLGVVQVGLQWAMFVMIFVLFIIYYPRELRYEKIVAVARGRAAGVVAAGDEEDGSDDEDGDSDDGSSIGDIDSVGSHIAANYSTFNGSGSTNSGHPAASTSAAAANSTSKPADSSAAASSTATSRSLWPSWLSSNAGHSSAKPAGLGPGLLSAPHRPSDRSALLTSAPRALRSRKRRPGNRVRKIKHKTPEWSLAIALAWIVAIHFLFITLVTLLLVSSLPDSAFPKPPGPDEPGPTIPLPPPTTPPHGWQWGHEMAAAPFGSSSRLLVSRWAAFLGITGTLLAAAQYVPQIVHTAKQRTVGSLSIPMMCLQVPGSALFVYSLAVRPGIEWTSLAAYVCTGVLQAALLVLCLCWKARQKRLGVDDYGQPLEGERGPLFEDGEED